MSKMKSSNIKVGALIKIEGEMFNVQGQSSFKFLVDTISDVEATYTSL